MEQMRLDENPGIVPVARATEVPTQLYFWRLIQLCGSNHFWRYWTIPWSTRNMKNLRSHLLMRGKKKMLPASKALITSYFLNIKGSLLSSFYFLCCSDMSCQSLYYAPVLSFLLWTVDRVGHLIWRLWGFWCPSIFLDFVTSGTFLPPYSFMSLPSLKVSCLFSVITILGSKNIFWKDFWANLSKLGPFLNLKLG